MESMNWVFILCLNSVSGKTIKVNHNQENKSLSTSLIVINAVALGCSSKYCYEVRVVEKTRKDCDNNKKTLRYSEAVLADARRKSHHRHRVDKEKKRLR